MKHAISHISRMPNGLRKVLAEIRRKNCIESDPKCPFINVLAPHGRFNAKRAFENAVKETNEELKKHGLACVSCPTWLELADPNDFGGDAIVKHYTDYCFLDGNCFVKTSKPNWKELVISDWIDNFGLSEIADRNIPNSFKKKIHIFKTKFVQYGCKCRKTVRVIGTSEKAIRKAISMYDIEKLTYEEVNH